MRVLYFTRCYTPHDRRFLTSLVESGQEAVLLLLEDCGRKLEDRPLPPGVRVAAELRGQWLAGQAPFHWRDVPARLNALKKLLREVRPDILHAGPIQTAAFLGALSGFRPLVAVSWGSDMLRDAERSWAYRWITRYTLSRATVLVGDCQAVRDKAASFGYPIAHTFMFPWGIDLQRFSPATGNGAAPSDAEALTDPSDPPDPPDPPDPADPQDPPDPSERSSPERSSVNPRSGLGWEDKFVILSLRSWEPVYGVDVMLRGFARAVEESAGSDDLRLLLLGGGSQAGLVQQIIQEHGLQDRVHLGGQVNQESLPKIYHAADLYASAAHSDGSSVSLMEALGCGLPVLVTDIPSNREWVADGVQGWRFADGDDQAAARSILRAYRLAKNQPAMFQKMREQARQMAEVRADWSRNFLTLLAAYERAIHLARNPEELAGAGEKNGC